jgi:hypothetical protein
MEKYETFMTLDARGELTEQTMIPVRMPRRRRIHQSPAPTRPAAPVPLEKYLYVCQRLLGWIELNIPDTVTDKIWIVPGYQLEECNFP